MLASWISITTCAGVFSQNQHNNAAADAFVAFVFIFAMVFAICWVNMIVAYPVEIFPCTNCSKKKTTTLEIEFANRGRQSS